MKKIYVITIVVVAICLLVVLIFPYLTRINGKAPRERMELLILKHAFYLYQIDHGWKLPYYPGDARKALMLLKPSVSKDLESNRTIRILAREGYSSKDFQKINLSRYDYLNPEPDKELEPDIVILERRKPLKHYKLVISFPSPGIHFVPIPENVENKSFLGENIDTVLKIHR